MFHVLINQYSAGENTKNQNGGKKEDERKTLSQQVADGKYGLIQKELFRKPPKRPGIISYSANSEVTNFLSMIVMIVKP